MKILFVNNARVCSGCEDHLIDIAVWFREHGVEPVFLVREASLLQERLEALGIKVHPVFIPDRKPGLLHRIAKAILDDQPDVISINREHNIMPVTAATMLMYPFLRTKPKMVAVFHTPTGRWYPGLGSFAGIIGTSDYTAESFIRVNPGIKEKTTVIHYGIKVPQADAASKLTRERPRKYFHGRKFPIIGMVGELWKNQEELVDAGRYLVERFPDITIAFIGGYEGLEPLQKRIAAAGLEEHFILTGRVPRELIPDIFYDLDLSVSTHRNEGFGIVHIESLAAYTPVVAYNSGGLVEIIRKGGGVLVEGETKEFADAVNSLLADDERRWALGAEGRRVVEENFSIDAMGRKHLAVYRKVVGGGT
ncbi:MAG: group 1 glycosyl [Geobacteraceae bacterium]|nr:MAG: group 1 glycosyl [Geobacteraceae bacterium]